MRSHKVPIHLLNHQHNHQKFHCLHGAAFKQEQKSAGDCSQIRSQNRHDVGHCHHGGNERRKGKAKEQHEEKSLEPHQNGIHQLTAEIPAEGPICECADGQHIALRPQRHSGAQKGAGAVQELFLPCQKIHRGRQCHHKIRQLPRRVHGRSGQRRGQSGEC